MNFNFRKLRKIASSLVVSGILACSGGSVVNGLGINSLNTFCWGALTAVCGTFTCGSIVDPKTFRIDPEKAYEAATVFGGGTLFGGSETIVSSRTTDMQDWYIQMQKNEEKRKKEIEQLQASMRNYSNSFNSYRSAVLNNYTQPIGNPNSAMQQNPPYNAYAPQDMRIANNMQQGRYNF